MNHADPADRLLVATARALDVPIVTRDRRVMSHAQAGLVAVISC
jgi:PIN domain nuclease of toxin-antitoxin system